MKKNAIFLFFIFSIFSVAAQEVISTQGDSYSGTGGGIDFTIGEVVIDTDTSGTCSIAQGFHQTNWNFVGIVNHKPDYIVTIFPNPVGSVLNIKTSSFTNVTYTLYDAQGKIVLQNILSAEQTALQVSQLAKGSYLLILNNATQNLKTFKLIKTN